MNYQKCLEFIKKKHKGQTRKQGTPYYTHPVAVSLILKQKGFPEEYQIAGLFHDLKEDTDATELEILELSNERVLDAVRLVTKYEGYDKSTYVEKIKNNEMARMVKLADKLHNLMDVLNAPELSFKQKTLNKTVNGGYIELAQDTVFEDDINRAIERLRNQIKQLETEAR